MSYPINYPTPQGANVQMFHANATSAATQKQTWIKPQGASFVFFCLIGAGGSGGDATSDGTAVANGGGGGSGAVLNCLVPAFFIPDQLQVAVGGRRLSTGLDTQVIYQQKDGTGYTLLSAGGGVLGDNATAAGGVAANGLGGSGGNPGSSSFRALGISNGTNGQNGTDGNVALTLPTNIFLLGGIGGNFGGTSLSPYHYGYITGASGQGYGVISPIINSVGNRDTDGALTSNGTRLLYTGFGCGGNGASEATAATSFGQAGGTGLAVIISW